jgi:hypothetical protein
MLWNYDIRNCAGLRQHNIHTHFREHRPKVEHTQKQHGDLKIHIFFRERKLAKMLWFTELISSFRSKVTTTHTTDLSSENSVVPSQALCKSFVQFAEKAVSLFLYSVFNFLFSSFVFFNRCSLICFILYHLRVSIPYFHIPFLSFYLFIFIIFSLLSLPLSLNTCKCFKLCYKNIVYKQEA